MVLTMTINQTRNEPDSYQLVRVAKEDSGLKFDIYLYSSGISKKCLLPIIEVEKGDKLTPLLITSDKKIELIEPSNLSVDELETIKKYITRNSEIIINHWKNKISDKEVLNLLYESDEKTNV